jgi:hypothetical protein
MKGLAMKSMKNSLQARRGFVSMPLMFVFLGMLVLFSFLLNTGLVVSRKVDAQNAADAVAYSTSLQRAKGMNAITAANHLMGELHAVTIMHHSFGGDELDGLKSKKKMGGDIRVFLRFSYYLARAMGSFKPFEFTYNAVYKDPEMGGAIGDSRIRLQRVMTWAYITHSIGGFLQTIGKFIPYAGKIIEGYGISVAVVATTFEVKAYQEWQVITGFQKIAEATKPVKTAIQKSLPAINLYAKGMQILIPFVKTPEALKKVAEENKVVADMFPGPYLPPAMLPVEEEPKVLSGSMIQRSQLTRASTPWVRHWRVPVLKFSEAVLKLSRFKMFYTDHTNNWTLELVKRAKKQQNLHLLIMKDVKLTTDDKGNEKWTKKDGSERADELFCSLGFAIRKSPKYAMAMFRNPTPDGIFAYSQAMVYNANTQQKKARPNEQRILGWDTLNWDDSSPIPAWKKDDTSKTFPVANVPEPRIRLNWSVKLVPASRMTLGNQFIKGIFWEEGRPHLEKILPSMSQTRTH